MHLLIATGNPHKVREIRAILRAVPVTLHSLAELPPVAEPDETGTTFLANARLKARYYAGHLTRSSAPWRAGALTVAEDSGLVIDALDGDPGVLSARFLRSDATYAERFAEIDRRLAQRPEAPRTARFICALIALRDGEEVFSTVGTVEGTIARQPSGTHGFGYDPIFFVAEYGATLAEVSEAAKLRIAHRGHAFRALGEWLQSSAG